MARIAIVGPGAIGGVMAAWLGRSGAHEVVLCARRPLAGLIVETPGETIELTPKVFTNPNDAPAVDWVRVATKTYDVAGAAAWLGPLCARGAPVAVLQNGVEHREHFEAYLPVDRIVPVLAYCPAERSTPTHIRQRRKALLIVPDDARGTAFASLFADTGVEVVPTPDFKTEAWKKLCVNAAGVINALLLQPAGVLRKASVAEL